MTIKIKEPTKEDLIEIITGLLSKKYTREEIVKWQEEVCITFNYYGPGVLIVPLKNKDGYWFFVSLSILLERNKLNSEEEYFIRERDLQYWLDDLMGIESKNLDAQIKNIKLTDKKDWKMLVCLICLNDSNNVISNKDKSFNFERGVFDSLGDLTEEALFEYRNFRFGIQKSYGYHLGQVDLAGEENIPEIIITELLDYIGIQNENLFFVNENLYKPTYKLVRMDNNGIKYVIAEGINYIEVYLKQKHFEKGIHKQSYWIE